MAPPQAQAAALAAALRSQAGTPTLERNLERVWYRVRRRAQKRGVRPLKLHCARHTWASLALASGKSTKWVAAQLGHSDPGFTLRTYAHVMPEEEPDVSFADFGAPGRPYTAPQENGAGDPVANPAISMVELRGIEPLTPRLPALCSPS